MHQPWSLTLSPSHHTLYEHLQKEKGNSSVAAWFRRATVCNLIATCLPSIDGSGKLQQTSQFSRKICDCNQNVAYLLETSTCKGFGQILLHYIAIAPLQQQFETLCTI